MVMMRCIIDALGCAGGHGPLVGVVPLWGAFLLWGADVVLSWEVGTVLLCGAGAVHIGAGVVL
jgi:hypothetical protein